MRIYLAGPMYGMPDNNKAAFNAAAKRLRAQGHFVINPVDFGPIFASPETLHESCEALHRHASQYKNTGYHIAFQMQQAELFALRTCDAIYLLKGWENSEGAKRELAEAVEYGEKVGGRKIAVMLEGQEEDA